MMMRVRLMRRPISTRITDRAQRKHTTTVGYHRNTCVLPRNGSAAQNVYAGRRGRRIYTTILKLEKCPTVRHKNCMSTENDTSCG